MRRAPCGPDERGGLIFRAACSQGVTGDQPGALGRQGERGIGRALRAAVVLVGGAGWGPERGLESGANLVCGGFHTTRARVRGGAPHGASDIYIAPPPLEAWGAVLVLQPSRPQQPWTCTFQQSHSKCAWAVANDDRNCMQHAHLKLFSPVTRLFARASGQKSMAACKRRHVHAPTCKETSARDGPRPETTVSPYFLADGREDPRAAPPEWLARAGTTSHRHWGNAWSL